jgi:hypothetical protein
MIFSHFLFKNSSIIIKKQYNFVICIKYNQDIIMLETFTERWDRTEELLKNREENRWKRRLDSIARLIENASTCAAIAIHDDSFLIATNKDFVTNSKDKGLILIDDVMLFLQKIANGHQYTSEEFKTVFTTICVNAMSGLQIMAYKREIFSQDEFINQVIEQDFRGLRDYISERSEEGHAPQDAGAAFVISIALLKDLKKIIQFVQQHKNLTNDSPTAKFIKAIKNYSQLCVINKDKLTGKVKDSEHMHAEMRIISLLEDKLRDKENKYENYIGISKLCCLDCHALIYAINKSSYKNKIDTRGAHNVSHHNNWSPPFNISKDLQVPSSGRSRSSGSDQFCNDIVNCIKEAYKLTKIKLDQKLDAIGAISSTEYPDDSHSSGDEKEEAMIQNFIFTLNKKKQELLQLKIPGIKVESAVFETIDQLLANANEKTTDLHTTLKNIAKNETNLSFILGYIRTLKEHQETAVAILSEPSFVGSKVADQFREQLNKQPKAVVIASLPKQSSEIQLATNPEELSIPTIEKPNDFPVPNDISENTNIDLPPQAKKFKP